MSLCIKYKYHRYKVIIYALSEGYETYMYMEEPH